MSAAFTRLGHNGMRDVRENKDLVRRLVQGWQHEHRSEVAEELIAGDFVDRDGAMSQPGASAPS